MYSLQKFLEIIQTREKIQGSILFLVITLTAFFDMVGIASLYPFMTALIDPSSTQNNPAFEFLSKILKLEQNSKDYVISLGFMCLSLFTVAIIAKSFATYLQIKFTLELEYSIGKRLMKKYLSKPYEWFTETNSSVLESTVISELNLVISHAVIPIITIFAQGLLTILLITLILFVDPMPAIFGGTVLLIIYFLIYVFAKDILSSAGDKRNIGNEARFRSIKEAFAGIKIIKVSGVERVFSERFEVASKLYVNNQALASILSLMPRYALEGVAFGGMISYLLYLLLDANSKVAAIIPVLALYGLAGYRLMPAIQQIYISAAQLKFVGNALEKINFELTSCADGSQNENNDSQIKFPITTAKKESKFIELCELDFKYPSAKSLLFSNFNLKIDSNSFVGVVGKTGCGKTTLIDLIMGLLTPNDGCIKINGKRLTKNVVRDWQSSIGYVPQQIFLTDNTVAENIAFGEKRENIDLARVESAAKIACINEMILSKLPAAYDTMVGEQGVRLSGGERQRIAIARALYRIPKLLILDEATSALDSVSERRVMENLKNIQSGMSIIAIAHRTSTLEACDRILVLEDGKLIDEGKASKLRKDSRTFVELSASFDDGLPTS